MFVSGIVVILLQLHWLLVLVLVTILVDLGNKLGIGQEKDVNRSSMLFTENNLMLLSVSFLVNNFTLLSTKIFFLLES